MHYYWRRTWSYINWLYIYWSGTVMNYMHRTNWVMHHSYWRRRRTWSAISALYYHFASWSCDISATAVTGCSANCFTTTATALHILYSAAIIVTTATISLSIHSCSTKN
jgi:hypothetical protein